MTDTSELNRILGLLIGWGLAAIAMLIGLFGVPFVLWNLSQGRASETWPEAPGKIIRSDIDSRTSRKSGTRRPTRTDTDYKLRVHYSYEVQGQTYESHRLRFGSSSHDKLSEAKQEQKRFPPGKEVQVYYDPENPKRAVLIRGVEGSWVQLIMLTVTLLFGVILGVFMLRASLQKPVSDQ